MAKCRCPEGWPQKVWRSMREWIRDPQLEWWGNPEGLFRVHAGYCPLSDALLALRKGR